MRPCRWATLFLLYSVLITSRSLAGSKPPVIVLLLDTSGSIRLGDLVRVQTLTRNLVTSLPARCEVAIYKFNDESRLVLEKTDQLQQIEQAIGILRQEGHFTALYDALFDASQYLERQPVRRRAILLLTDGMNEGGQMSLGEGLEIARKQRIPVFTVGMGRAVNQRVLRRIAEQTGGTYSDLSTTTGQQLANSVQKAFSLLPEEPPESAQSKALTSNASARPNRTLEGRIYWMSVILILAGALVGFILRWIFRKSRPHSTTPPLDETATDETATAMVPKREPAEELKAIQAPLLKQVPPTVRLPLQVASLKIKEGRGEGQIFSVPSSRATLLGRSPSADVLLDDPAVSSEHCRIVPDGGGYVLYDLKSTNGTKVNSATVKEKNLENGDLIQVGHTNLEFSFSQ